MHRRMGPIREERWEERVDWVVGGGRLRIKRVEGSSAPFCFCGFRDGAMVGEWDFLVVELVIL